MKKKGQSLFLLLLCPGVALTQEPPLNPPVNYSHIIGRYTIDTAAEPLDVGVEEPLQLTVRISGDGPAGHHPRRENLHIFPEDMERDFFIEPLPEKDRQEGKTWVFVYRLKPRHLKVTAIPALELVHYDGRKKFPNPRSPNIPITVKPPRTVTAPPGVAARLKAPESFLQFATGPEVLSQPRPAGHPWLVLWLLLPPTACSLWWWQWRRQNAATRQRLQMQQHHAARKTMHTLQAAKLGADQLAQVMIDYLRRRLDLPGAEPTPREVEHFLHGHGVSRQLRQDVMSLLQKCDAGRFGPPPPLPAGDGITSEAMRLVQALEEEPCCRRDG